MGDFRKTFTCMDSSSGYLDLTANHSNPMEPPGQERSIMTAYGPAKVRYGKATGSAATRGQLFAYKANVDLQNITSGSTTTLVTAALTANEHQYDIALCYDDAAAGGASPEGYCSPIIKNTTTTVYLDPNNPLPTAAAAGDDFWVISYSKAVAAAAGMEVNDGFGIAATTITQDYWGWFFFDGICPYALVKANTTLTAAKALIADTARVSVSSTSADQLLIGITLGKVQAANDLVDDVFAVRLWNLGQARGLSA